MMTQSKLRFRAHLRNTKAIVKGDKVVSSDDSAMGSDVATLEHWAKGKFERLSDEDLWTAAVDIYEIEEKVVKIVTPQTYELYPSTPHPAPTTGPCGVCGAPNCKRHVQGYQLGKPGL